MIKSEYRPYLNRLIELAIAEDIGDGDHSSLSSIPENECGRMKLLIKEHGILAGVEIAEIVFRTLDPAIEFEHILTDGTLVDPGDVAFYVRGRMHTLLQGERIVLNIMQRMSGVATQTSHYVHELKGLNTKLLDTRKTTPGMRVVDKMAVEIGGGTNHRMGLFDMIMLKDNHIDFAGGIAPALSGAKRYLTENNLGLKIEIEVRTIADIEQVLAEGGADRIMLDNFGIAQTRHAVTLIAGRVQTESSGGITIANLRSYALCGVDYISVGALTHQIKSLDMSLKVY